MNSPFLLESIGSIREAIRFIRNAAQNTVSIAHSLKSIGKRGLFLALMVMSQGLGELKALTYPTPETPLSKVTWVSAPKSFPKGNVTFKVLVTEALSGKPAGGPVRLMYSTDGCATASAYAWADYKDGIAEFIIRRPPGDKGVVLLVALYDGSDRAFSTSEPLLLPFE